MKWVRLATTIGADPSIGQLADELRTPVPFAVGLCALVFAQLPEHARDGDLSQIGDATIERWAQWSGKRGVFAQQFRSILCDENGLVSAWEKHNGAAIRQSDAALERKKRSRNDVSVTRDTPEPVTRDTPEPVTSDKMGDGTGRDVNYSSSTTGAHVENFHDADQKAAYQGFLRAAHNPSALDRQLLKIAQPITGNGFGWDVLGKALEQMAGNGVAWNFNLARGYCRNIVTPPPARTGPPGRASWALPDPAPTNVHREAPPPRSTLCAFCSAVPGLTEKGRPDAVHEATCHLYNPSVLPLHPETDHAA